MSQHTRNHILNRLSHSQQTISGHLLAQELGISRSAVWKSIDQLRKQGANIEAVNGQGYQLKSDFFDAITIQSNMPKLKRLGQNIMHFKQLDSTNREAMRQGEAGQPEGLVIFADEQSAGRGRLGRTWHTCDDSLALSLLLRPALKPEQVPQLSLVTAVALHHALSHFCPDIRIKWPNDLLIHGAKVSGILTEMRAEPGMVHAVIVGIGINLHSPKQGWPSDIKHKACSLQDHSTQPISKLAVAQATLHALDKYYDIYLQQGFAPIREAWWQAHAASGQKVRVHQGQGYIEGIAHSLDEDGALILQCSHGKKRIIAGELELLNSISTKVKA
ncbi:MAG: biotin--[acetyl-CoA-carboxylase] ligase [Mariprofundaceae bacterium]